MSKIVGIINYGISGNIHSIKKVIEKAGGKPIVIDRQEQLKLVDKIVIPGVGSFKDAMDTLQSTGLFEPLKASINTKPTLGICLGMQILSKLGFEYGRTEGLSKVKAEVKPIVVDAKVPHMGFNSVKLVQDCNLFKGIENEQFYFMHSYEMVNYTDIVGLTNYCGHDFVSSIQKENIYGVQFHPEKSREAGIQLFRNFIAL